MIIGIANDHHGVEVKKKIKTYLDKLGVQYIDYGTNEVGNVDYIDYAYSLCSEVKSKNVDLGILICGTGIGMSIVANKISGIICAKVSNEREAFLSRNHNMANVMAIGEDIENVENVVKSFIETEVSKEERHFRRRNKIMLIERGEYNENG